MRVANSLSPKAILQADFIHFITFLMNLISLWNQSEFLSDPRLLPGQSGKLSKNDQKDSKYWADLNITHAREAVKKITWIKTLPEWKNIFYFPWDQGGLPKLYFYCVIFPFNPGVEMKFPLFFVWRLPWGGLMVTGDMTVRYTVQTGHTCHHSY